VGARLEQSGEATSDRRSRPSPSAAPRRRIEAALPALIIGLTLLVQLLVWGRAPATGTGGALLPELRPVFGAAYSAVLVAAELAVCRLLGVRDAAVWVLVAGALVGVVFWLARLAGSHFPFGTAVSATAAAGAVALGAAVWWRRGQAPSPR